MAKKITLLEVSNYKKIRDITIAPGDHSMILIGGRNGAGKSSLLGAMSAALGGKGEVADEPVRKGQKQSDIRITFGDIVVHLRVKASGSKTLTVTVDGEKKKAPQKILDELFGGRFINPVSLMNQSEAELRASLLKCVKLDLDLDAHAKERASVFAARAVANKDAKRLEAELATMGPHRSIASLTPPASVDDLLAELERLEGEQRRGERAIAEQAQIRDQDKTWHASIEGLIATVDEAQANLDSARITRAKWFEAAQDRSAELEEVATLAGINTEAEIEDARESLRGATAATQEHARLVAGVERCNEVGAAMADATCKAEELTDELTELDEQKAAALAAAQMPVDGLDVDESRVLYDGVPLSQASGAERLRVFLAIAAAMSPGLADIRVEDGSLLDDDSLALVDDFAKANNKCVWVERVGEGDDGAIIIEEGEVKQ